MAVPDYIDIFNSAGVTKPPIPPIPSFVSFDVRWKAKPKAKLTRITNTAEQVTGRFIDSNATIVWSAHQPSTGFRFTSAPTPTTTISGVIGRERNGRFFSSDADGDGDSDD